MKKLKLYTDGGASPNPGRGGWAAVLVRDGVLEGELSGGELDTSNNRMELTAAIEGLGMIEDGESVALITDSNYLRLGITEWIISWKRNGWKTAARKSVKNKDLWIRLDQVVSTRNVEWSWVKGHSGDKWNEHVDEMVGMARNSLM